MDAKRKSAFATLREHEPELRARGVQHAAIFGSLARGESGPDRDVDVLIDLDRNRAIGLFEYAGIRLFVAELPGTESDVVHKKTLKPLLRESILRDAVDAFQGALEGQQGMASKNSAQRLHDIQYNIDVIGAFITGISFEQFGADLKTAYAVTPALAIISEASRRLPDILKERHTQIPWAEIAAAGNAYRHEYEASG